MGFRHRTSRSEPDRRFKTSDQLRRALGLVRGAARIKVFHGFGDGRIGTINFVILRSAGRIRSVTPDAQGALSVVVEGSSLAGVQVVGRFISPHGQQQFREPVLEGAELRLIPTATPIAATVALVASNGDLLDLARVDLQGIVVSPGIDEEWLRAAAAAGESGVIEFKPYVNLSGDKKWEEVLQTCVAFANSSGGVMFIGLDDQGEANFGGAEQRIVRAHGAAPSVAGGQPETAALDQLVTSYAARLRDRIQQFVNRSIDMSTSILTIGIAPVVVLRVDQGNARPYMDTRDNSIWVRANATTRRPTEDELRMLLADQDDPELYR